MTLVNEFLDSISAFRFSECEILTYFMKSRDLTLRAKLFRIRQLRKS